MATDVWINLPAAQGTVTVIQGTTPWIVGVVPTKTVYSVFNSISSVSNGVLTTILSYTVPIGKTDYLSLIEASGSNMAQFELYLNGTLNARQRTSLTEFNSQFNFLVDSEIGLPLSSGTLVEIKVIQDRPYLGDYEARMVYAE